MTIRSYLMATFYDSAMKQTEKKLLLPYRKKLLSMLDGTVLEIGSGTGINLQFYKNIETLICSEPDENMRKQLVKKIALHDEYPIELLHSSGEKIDLEDNSVDHVVSTLVMCSVRDQEKVMSEIRRVLKPNGTFSFIEHVCSHNKNIAKWQSRFTPTWSYLFDNCHLDRHTAKLIEDSGMETHIEELKLSLLSPVFESWITGTALNKK